MAKIQDLIGKKFWMLTVIDVKREKIKLTAYVSVNVEILNG